LGVASSVNQLGCDDDSLFEQGNSSRDDCPDGEIAAHGRDLDPPPLVSECGGPRDYSQWAELCQVIRDGLGDSIAEEPHGRIIPFGGKG
jgi:hypothetical protein